jgi:replicative DNA helicase
MRPAEFAEVALLGSLLNEPARIVEVEQLHDSDFGLPEHGVIFRHLRRLVADPPREGQSLQAHRAAVGARLTATAGLAPGRIDDVQAKADQHAVPGVTPMAVYASIAAAGELGHGSRAISAVSLHNLMAAAPSPAQPRVYAALVGEAALRRWVHRMGMRVEQAAEGAPDLRQLLNEVELASAELDDAQHRWEVLTGQAVEHDSPVVDAPLAAGSPAADPTAPMILDEGELIETPDPQAVHDAELAVIGNVLNSPQLLDEVSELLVDRDFADSRLGDTYAAAVAVHAGSLGRGVRVDTATVLWEQQRQGPQGREGLPDDELRALAATAFVGTPEYHVDLVLRGSLARLTANAAAAVQAAAQHPGLTVGDMLHTSRMVLAAVEVTGQRMTRRPLTPARLLAQSSPVPITEALHHPAGARPAAAPAPPPPVRDHQVDTER